MTTMAPELTLQEVSISRGSRRIIAPLNLALAPGKILGVLGPNGVGKTSLLTACTGELQVSSGVIRYGDHVLNPKDARGLSRIRAVLPQQSQLSFNLPVHQVIRMGVYPFPELSPTRVSAWFEYAVHAAEVGPYLSRSYQALSGGEQQRVQFARVLLQTLAITHTRGHAYLFLDEPTASLDLRHQARLFKEVQRLARSQSVAVFVVLHDLNLAARWCEMVLLLSPNYPAAYGKTNAILTKKSLECVYGVEMHIQPHPFRPNQLLILSEG